MTCKICHANSTPCMEIQLLGKYDVRYYRCNSCQFIQTEEPYWLDEAYSSAIASLDIGLIQRNEIAASIVQAIIHKWFDPTERFVDYGGGYGMLVRMMRDRGFDFYRYDTHCDNLFAQTFDAPPSENGLPFELVTAFEVFEHLVNPIESLDLMLTYSRNIFFSTELQPTNWRPSPNTWWYILPETGQHVSLYTARSLHILAEQRGMHYVTGGSNMHLFSEQPVSKRWFTGLTSWRGSQFYNQLSRSRRTSLLDADFAKLRQQQTTTNPFVR